MRKDYQFKSEPREHQLKAIAFNVEHGRAGNWLDIGTGKTLTAIYSACLLNANKVLVVCPNSVIRTWKEELEKHTNLSYIELVGEAAQRRQAIHALADFYIINYEGLRTLWAEKAAITRGKNKGVMRYRPLSPFPDIPFDCIIFDESHALGDWLSLQTKISFFLSMKARYVFHLTGTPDDGKLVKLWSQYWVLDGGRSLGRSFQAYVYEHFKVIQAKGSRSFPIYSPKKSAMENILQRVSEKTIRIDRRDCTSLPELVFQKRYCRPSAEQQKLIADIKSGLKSRLADHGIRKQIVNHSIKLMQVSSGFYLDGTRTLELKANPKVELLFEVLGSTSSKVIVFHAFEEEGRIIERGCAKRGIGFRSLRGEIKDKDRHYREFKEKPNIQLLVCHPRSGGVGLNLQEASVVVFFSVAFVSPTIRSQCIGRIHREGQKSSCTVVDLCVEDSIDEVMLTSLEKNTDLAQAILNWLR